MLIGRCSWELSGRKLHRKIKKSQTPRRADRGKREESVRRSGVCAANWDDCADYDGQASTATDRTTDHGNAITLSGFREPHDIGNSH